MSGDMLVSSSGLTLQCLRTPDGRKVLRRLGKENTAKSVVTGRPATGSRRINKEQGPHPARSVSSLRRHDGFMRKQTRNPRRKTARKCTHEGPHFHANIGKVPLIIDLLEIEFFVHFNIPKTDEAEEDVIVPPDPPVVLYRMNDLGPSEMSKTMIEKRKKEKDDKVGKLEKEQEPTLELEFLEVCRRVADLEQELKIMKDSFNQAISMDHPGDSMISKRTLPSWLKMDHAHRNATTLELVEEQQGGRFLNQVDGRKGTREDRSPKKVEEPETSEKDIKTLKTSSDRVDDSQETLKEEDPSEKFFKSMELSSDSDSEMLNARRSENVIELLNKYGQNGPITTRPSDNLIQLMNRISRNSRRRNLGAEKKYCVWRT